MSMFTDLNKGTKLFNVEVEHPTFKKINQFNENEVVQVLGCYTNKKSTFGDEPIFIVRDYTGSIYFVNMPKHHLDTLNTIITNAELVQGINDGKCFIKIITYYSKKYKKNCFDFEFVESSIEEMKKQQATEQATEEVEQGIF